MTEPGEQLAIGGRPARARRRSPARRAVEPAALLPVARVVVDVGLAHLDRPFDYLVPHTLDASVVPGGRVRVRFAGQLVDGFVVERVAASDHAGALAFLAGAPSAEPVLAPEVLRLARAVAERYAGTLADVLRLAVPPRHAAAEAAPEPTLPPGPGPAGGPGPDEAWAPYEDGPAYLRALAAGRAPRAVWAALPGAVDWAVPVAAAVEAALAAGRGALVVVPDARDVARVDAALAARLGAGRHAVLTADLGPRERYRRFLSVSRGEVRAVVGTRAATFAPVADLGLVVLWDDGDDLHAEPRAPYPHAREVLVLRAHLAGAAALLGGHAVTAEGAQLVATGWARPLRAPRQVLRRTAPRVDALGDTDVARDPAAHAARLPTLAWEAARAALAAGAPVLVQVPRRGYQPALACADCREPARCPTCAGPLGRAAGGADAVPACRWCGRPAAGWACPHCGGRRLRAVVVGARRTAEELGRAFPGVAVRTSGRSAERGGVLAAVPAGPALVVATPGAEPVAPGGYGAVLLLDAWALLGRPDLRAAEETLRRWLQAAALARPGPAGGRVVVTADAGLPAVQALVRWDPFGSAERELADRRELRFPPAVRVAALTGPAAAVAELAGAVELPAGAELLGPVPVEPPPRVPPPEGPPGAARPGPPGTGPPGAPSDAPGQPGPPAHPPGALLDLPGAPPPPGVPVATGVPGPSPPVVEGHERLLVRVDRRDGPALAAALKAALAVRSARKAEPVRVQLDPLTVL